MIVAVTGGRRYSDRAIVYTTLSKIHRETPITLLVHGASKGADTLADQWAKANGVAAKACPADWNRKGGVPDYSAGPRRNTYMLDNYDIELLVSFPGADGTADMTRKSEKRGVKVIRVGAGISLMDQMKEAGFTMPPGNDEIDPTLLL